MANFNANANTEDGVFVFNVGDHVKNKINGEKGVVTEIVHDVFFGDSLRVKLESQNKSLGINMVSPETQERYIGLLLPFGFWVKCRDAHEKSQWFGWDERGLELVESKADSHDKFDWEAFKRGDVTVTFKTNESQRQFLKRCETHGMKWASGDNPTLHSYWNAALGRNRDGTLGYGCPLDSRPMVYDWDARKYIKRAKRAEKPSTDWTAEEIELAKELSRKLLCKIFDDGGSVKWVKVSDSSCGTFAVFYNRFGSASDIFKSKPSGSDKFNEWIAKCVCLCKATGTPIPSFILNKNKERK